MKCRKLEMYRFFFFFGKETAQEMSTHEIEKLGDWH
jgi:hypothetical protein